MNDCITDGPSSSTVIEDRIRICLSNLILRNFCKKTDEREAESIILILVLVLSSFVPVQYFRKI